MEVRLALNSEGSIIRRLAEAQTLPKEFRDVFNWDDIFPYWLVAENGAGIVGCIQVCPGKPMGRLENLSLDVAMAPQQKARAAKMLIDGGAQTLRTMGSSVTSSMISFQNKSFKRMLKRHFDYKVTTSGNVMMRAL
jgi:hypothetical protein